MKRDTRTLNQSETREHYFKRAVDFYSEKGLAENITYSKANKETDRTFGRSEGHVSGFHKIFQNIEKEKSE